MNGNQIADRPALGGKDTEFVFFLQIVGYVIGLKLCSLIVGSKIRREEFITDPCPIDKRTVKTDGTLIRMFCWQRALSRLTWICSGRREM